MAFQKGKSGNPRGRPKGTGGTESIRAQLRQVAPGILAKLLEQFRDTGDLGAAKLILERALPPYKGIDSVVSIPQIKKAETLAGKGDAVLNAAAVGEITPSQASNLLSALAAQARLIESTELQERLNAVEKQMGGKS